MGSDDRPPLVIGLALLPLVFVAVDKRLRPILLPAWDPGDPYEPWYHGVVAFVAIIVSSLIFEFLAEFLAAGPVLWLVVAIAMVMATAIAMHSVVEC